MTIVITGGCGFIGQHLARAIQGDGLVALDSLHPQVHARPRASAARFPGRVVVGDVAEAEGWRELPMSNVSAVVHLAAETGTGQSMYERERYFRVNVDGTAAAAAYAERVGAPLVLMSSRAVYGDGVPDRASRESDPHRPVSVYGESKSAAEERVAGLAVPVTVIRPQNVVGPGQAVHNPYTGVLAAFVARLREGRPLTIYGDGTATRDFVHVADLVALTGWAIDHMARATEAGTALTLNCGTGVRTTLLELARHAMAGSPAADVPIEHLDLTRAGDINHACADLSRLTDVGAPLPRHTSREAVIDFVRWAWEQPGVASSSWDRALDELSRRGLTRHVTDESHGS